jgi:exosortase C (VPDSG-CTERM-specific)
MTSDTRSRRLWGFAGYLGLLLVALGGPLIALALRAAQSDIDSCILLIPFVCAYLLHIGRKQLARDLSTSIPWAAAPAVIGAGSLAAFLVLRGRLDQADDLEFAALSFVAFLWAGGFLFLGRHWMASAAFPMALLIFMVPLPEAAVNWLETALKLASADAAALFFAMTGMPVLRNGTVFQLPGIAIEVAQECSGIHSTWVLFITSLIASHLFLKSAWRQAALVAFVIPLGILRNGFRILVIGFLCVHVGPFMIDSPIHRHGGPLFFILSLIPLLALLLWLRKGQLKHNAPKPLKSPDAPLAPVRRHAG